MTRIGLIIASARPNRVGAPVASWIEDALRELETQVELDRIELAEVALPAFDEPTSPKSGAAKTTQHGRDWEQRIGALDAAVIITPQYNGSYPGALKNAVDWLYAEWKDLPLLLVGYGWGEAAEVLGHLGPLMERLEAEVVGSVGLGFREDLTAEGELHLREETIRSLHEGARALVARCPSPVA